jgi:hypothetical protein
LIWFDSFSMMEIDSYRVPGFSFISLDFWFT